ncbi:hypothetical protein DdX_19834 [Ditylenchus destructor]|uniref:Transposase n=1 Tax=Ditylenchus destructor TaxID=166010 RepID=A0AAD4MH56_9BILA|nr:hypothetical protein DdX_19834 [Ditylenchus destructor]
MPSDAKARKGTTHKENRMPKTPSQQITYHQLETNKPEITDEEVINHLQKYNILQKEVICQKCGKNRRLYYCSGKWQWYCNKPKCENPVGLRVNNWISKRKFLLPGILRFLYCWSRQMVHDEIVKNVGCANSTCLDLASSVREVCAWYVYDRNPTKVIGGKGMIVEVDVKEFGKKMLVLGAVCRETEEKWMVVVPNCESDTLKCHIDEKVHRESTIVTGRNFEAHCAVYRLDNNNNCVSEEPNAAHSQTIERALDSLEELNNKALQWAPRKQWASFVPEWLWRDEIRRKGCADTFDEILKIIAEYWPAGATKSKSTVEGLQQPHGHEPNSLYNVSNLKEVTCNFPQVAF